MDNMAQAVVDLGQELVPFPVVVIRDSRRISTSVDYSKLLANREGIFSTILPHYTSQVVDIVRRFFPEAAERCHYPGGQGLRILDATANIGGDAINFVHNFPKATVTAVEVNPDNVEILRHNVEALGMTDAIQVIEANCLTYVNEFASTAYDFVYFDPPWGGTEVWKGHESLVLELAGEAPADGASAGKSPASDSVPIHEAVAQVFNHGVSDAVLLKAPSNFDIRSFSQQLEAAGCRCSIDKESVFKKPRSRIPLGLAYHLYVIKVVPETLVKSADASDASADDTALSANESDASAQHQSGLFARLGEWFDAGNHDDTLFVQGKIRTFLLKQFRNAPGRAIEAAVATIVDAGRRRRGDGETLADIAKILARHRPRKAARERQGKGRAASRIDDIAPTLKKVLAGSVEEYLDIGCAEGGLTTAFGAALGLEAENTHGCDIVSPADAGEGFVFATAPAERLPYRDGQFQLVTFIMSLHHLKDLRASLAEAGRVLAPGGTLVIREHDCRTEAFAVFLDLVHFLYATVVNDEVILRRGHENEDFEAHRDRLVSTFRTKEEWSRELDAAGFTFVCKRLPATRGGRKTDMYNSYYAFYRASD